jgi:hypothetical protein
MAWLGLIVQQTVKNFTMEEHGTQNLYSQTILTFLWSQVAAAAAGMGQEQDTAVPEVVVV